MAAVCVGFSASSKDRRASHPAHSGLEDDHGGRLSPDPPDQPVHGALSRIKHSIQATLYC